MKWVVTSTSEYDVWFGLLAENEQSELLAKVMLLADYGPDLRRPHADTLAGSKHPNMKELRAKTSTAEIRVAFVSDPHRIGILLMGGEKQGVNQRRFYKTLIATADKLYDRHLKSIRK